MSGAHESRSPAPVEPVWLRHNKVDLALWQLRSGSGRPLLVLHGLGERSDLDVVPGLSEWEGPIHGLDFTGHGASSVPSGGGYFCEALMADADMALQHLGEATVVGRGLGGYVALLIAGARPAQVRGAVVLDGPGLHGAGPTPATLDLTRPAATGTTPDPLALVELARDVRPPDYARTFAWQASALSGLDVAVAVASVNRPPWLSEVISQPGVVESDLQDALRMFAAAPAA